MDSQAWFSKHANLKVKSLGAIEYLTDIEQVIENESTNADYWLGEPTTKKQVLAIAVRYLITMQAQEVANKSYSCEYMIEH